jgi:transcriptional regulator with PAS, ATPase and Fis domain
MQDTLTQNLAADCKTWTAIFDSSHNGIAVIDRDGIVLVFNPAARQIFNETERSLDIPAPADHFITKLNRERKLKKRLSREVIDRLKEYLFPGNIRELINISEILPTTRSCGCHLCCHLFDFG